MRLPSCSFLTTGVWAQQVVMQRVVFELCLHSAAVCKCSSIRVCGWCVTGAQTLLDCRCLGVGYGCVVFQVVYCAWPDCGSLTR
ncbi:hypothetical protein COO60DRAFT_1552438 [Scenedesmus sp. NREL 46B-D3]|nr:hypothetical protein COO60DRAFT_1552438 [Scenedesmus sp. NREL 46B-D3]